MTKAGMRRAAKEGRAEAIRLLHEEEKQKAKERKLAEERKRNEAKAKRVLKSKIGPKMVEYPAPHPSGYNINLNQPQLQPTVRVVGAYLLAKGLINRKSEAAAIRYLIMEFHNKHCCTKGEMPADLVELLFKTGKNFNDEDWDKLIAFFKSGDASNDSPIKEEM